MKTVKMLAPGKIDVIQTEKPKLEKGTALLEILYGGICGSDLGTYRGISHMSLIRESRGTNFLLVWSRWIKMSMESSRE